MKRLFNYFSGFFENFSKNTSIHGIQFIGNINISRPERILWFIIVILAFASSYTFIKSNWDHYSANPTVVTIKKDFRKWENPFPAATACFIDKVDEEKANNYIQKKWGVSKNHNKYEYYMDIIRTVSNLTYKTFHSLERFKNDESFRNIQWISLLLEVHPPLNGVLVTFETKTKPKWQFIITELGLCFSFNSRLIDLMSPSKMLSSINRHIIVKKEFLKCHYLNGLCYARYDSDPNLSLEYYIHSNLEVVHFTTEAPLLVQKSEEYEINFKLSETYSVNNVRYLTPLQRKCRFLDEPLIANVPVYAISICFMECRYRFVMDRCGCKPFFYNFFVGKICDIKGLLCISKILHLFNQSSIMQCNCPQPCNFMVYSKQIPMITKWSTGYFDQRITFRWGLMPPMTKYQRKIIFGFQELIVSFGGVLSLFLGVSFMSILETIYLICYYVYSLIANLKEERSREVQFFLKK